MLLSHRDLSICVVVGVLSLGCGAASTQPAPSSSPFQARVEELARALQNDPRLKNLSEQQRMDRVEFVVGNTLFVLLHEMSHVLIAEMKLPVLGREEDAADTFAALALLKMGTSFSQRVLAAAAKGWFLSDRRDQQTGAEPLFYDEHNLSQQRAYQIVCFMVGSDPAKFKSLADETKMPEARQQRCTEEDYPKAARSWNTVLEPHRRASGQPETRINVAYGDAEGDFEVFARSFRAIQMLEAVAQRVAGDFVWPAPFNMEMQSCGAPEAVWLDKTRTLRICYELAFDFAQLYRAYVPAESAPVSTNQKRKRKSK
jgi:Putative metallopeptidase